MPRIQVYIAEEDVERLGEAAGGVAVSAFVGQLIVQHLDGKMTQAQVADRIADIVSKRLSAELEQHLAAIDASLHGVNAEPALWVPAEELRSKPDEPVRGELPPDVSMKPWGLMRIAMPYDPQCENIGTEAHGKGRWCSLCAGNGLPRDVPYEDVVAVA